MRRVASVVSANTAPTLTIETILAPRPAAAATASAVTRSGPMRNSSVASGSGLWVEKSRFVSAIPNAASPSGARRRARTAGSIDPSDDAGDQRDDGEDERRPDVDRESKPDQPHERDAELDQRVGPAEQAGALRGPDVGDEHRGGHAGAPAVMRAAPRRLRSSAATQPSASSMRRSVASRTNRSSWVAASIALPCSTSSFERRHQRLVAAPVLAVRRLVEREQERPAGEPGHEREPALLAAGERVRAPVAELSQRQSKPVAQLVGEWQLLRLETQLHLLAHGIGEEAELRILDDVAGEARNLRRQASATGRGRRAGSCPPSGEGGPSRAEAGSSCRCRSGRRGRFDRRATRRGRPSAARAAPRSKPNRTPSSSTIGGRLRLPRAGTAALRFVPRLTPARRSPSGSQTPARSSFAPDRFEDLGGGPTSIGPPVVVERQDEVRDRPRELGSMLDQHDRGGASRPEIGEDREHRGRALRVEIRGRLVEDEQARRRREHAGDRDALLLTAGQARRAAALEAGEPDLAEHLRHARPHRDHRPGERSPARTPRRRRRAPSPAGSPDPGARSRPRGRRS